MDIIMVISKRSDNFYTTVFIEDKTGFQLIGVVYSKAYRYTKNLMSAANI